MKTAKEWAESVVTARPHEQVRSGKTFLILFEHGDDFYVFDQVDAAAGVEVEEAEHYRSIIERLVERVQADAQASLDDAVAQREAYIRGLQREVNEWRKMACDRGRVLGDVADALEELRGVAVPGSAAAAICERLLPKIEEALR